MKKLHRTVTLLLTLFAIFVFAPAAFAHPLGNFTINQYVGLRIGREIIRVDYIVDMAEIPAFQELAPYDSDRDRQPDSPAIQNYPAEKCASLRTDLTLILNEKPLPLTPTSSSVEFPVGVGGLPTLRLTCEFQTMFDPPVNALVLSFVNNAFPDRMGWKEVVVIADGVSLEGEYSTTSLSNRLTNYPEDLLTSPPDQRRVDLEIAPVASLVKDESLEPATAPVSSLSNRDDGFTKLILLEEITFPTLLLALAVSFIWGAAHAMTPGHGKTIVGAYLVGSRGTIKHAVYLGITTTVTHTIGVFALGLITLFAAQYVVPEKLFPWLSLLSGLFVVGIGFNLFVERFRSSAMGAWFRRVKSNRLRFQPAFSPTGQGLRIENSERKQSFVLAPRHQHPHDDGQHHSHDHHETAGYHHDHDHEHAHHHGHDHSDHSHQPPEEITWRSLLALGVSGGLLPCPSALVVLLGAIALNKIGFGLILVLAFSLGLAGALTAIGVAFLYAGKLFERFPASGRVIGILPAFSALFISLIGLGIVIKAAMEIGVV